MLSLVKTNSLFWLVILLAAAFQTGIQAEAGEKKNAPYYKLTIESKSYAPGQLIDTIDIEIESSGRLIGGVDLKIGSDSPALEILEIIPGEIPDSCNWKFFNTRDLSDRSTGDSPTGMWQVLTLAQFGADTARPICYGFDRKASIARLIVHVDASQIDLETDSTLQLFFYWEDCGDNTVTNLTGDSLYFSLLSVTPENSYFTLPSRQGAPTSCIKTRARNKPVRAVAFESGGVVIVVAADTTESDL
jgi:hypothetical protein